MSPSRHPMIPLLLAAAMAAAWAFEAEGIPNQHDRVLRS